MITEDYVSFETAKLLKENSFNENCSRWYFTISGEIGEYNITDRSRNSELYIDAPTLQMAMKWLREIYKLEVRSTYDYDKDSWWGSINPMFEETDENSDIYQKALGFDYQGKSYEEACEAAITYSLKYII